MLKEPGIVIVINTVSKPLQLGLYENGKLIKAKELNGLASDVLLPALKDLLKNYRIEKIYYTSGPGSHMGTKIVYVLLKTLNIIKGIPFFAISSFDLNGDKPIKALGKLYFVKEKETIITKRFEKEPQSSFYMPKNLEALNILENNEPDYQIAAV